MKSHIVLILATSIVFLNACTGTPVKYSGEQLETAEKTDGAEAVNEGATAGKGKKLTKVCKEYKPTGSRISKRLCRTQEAWDEIERKAQEGLDNMTKPQSNNPNGT